MVVANVILIGLALALWFGCGWHPLAAWLVAVNLVAFSAFGFDKFSARKKWRRISEADLLYGALIGGSIGAWLGMRAFRHKTRKAEFRRSYWIIVVVQVALVGAWFWFG